MWLRIQSGLLLFIPEMVPSLFYGTSKHVNIIPDVGSLCDDDIYSSNADEF